jgi:hypothetical protein
MVAELLALQAEALLVLLQPTQAVVEAALVLLVETNTLVVQQVQA